MPKFKGSCGCYSKDDARELGLSTAVVWNDILDRAEHFDSQKIWYDQKMASERLGIPNQTISRCLKTLETAERVTLEGGYRPNSTIRTTWVTIAKKYLDENLNPQNGESKESQNGESTYNDTKKSYSSSEQDDEPSSETTRMKPEQLYSRVHSFFGGRHDRRKAMVESLRKIQNDLSDEAILGGFQEIAAHPTFKGKEGKEITWTLVKLLLRDDEGLERTANVLARAVEKRSEKDRKKDAPKVKYQTDYCY